MEDNENRHNNIINKVELLKFINKKQGSIIDEKEEPTFKLINNYSEINILLNNNSDKFKFIYFHRIKIKKILYDCEKEVNIDSDKIENTLDKIFYLSLLVTENKEIINYKYSIDYIKNLNKFNEKNNLKLKKIISSKIILDLIEYFEGFDEYNESTKSCIDDIRNKNIDIIKNNNNILKDFHLNNKNFINKSIEEIYINIIKTLLHQYKDFKNIINELDLEKIDLTNNIFKEISKILSSDKSIKEININDINDLFNEDKIEFYYILLKYLLKNQCYIYQIPILMKARKIILKNKKFIKNGGNINKEKLEYLIETLTGSKYYFKQFGILQNDNMHLDMKQNKKNKQLEEELKMNENILKPSNNSIEKFLNEDQQQNQNLSTKYVTSKKLEEQDKNIVKDNKKEDNGEKTNIESQCNENKDINVEYNNPKKIDYKGNQYNSNKDINAENNKPKTPVCNGLKIVQYIEKISYILEEISINYLFNGNKTITVKTPNGNKIIDYDDLIDLKNYKYIFDMDKEQFIKYASFLKLVNFIQKVEELKQNKKNLFNISIKLEHEKLYEKQNKNGIYNIKCRYGFFSEKIKLYLNYKDENILLNGFNQGFLALLCEINEFK